MFYKVFFKGEARDQLRDLPKQIRRRIGYKVYLLQQNLAGDIKKLKAREQLYRLRIGSYRVFFTLEKDEIQIYSIKDRKDAYD